MQSYLQRYLDGEVVGVWTELVALGPAVRDEPIISDARAVALEMMTRAKHNIALIIERLTQLEYRFLSPEDVWSPPDGEGFALLEALERRYGPFPLVLRKWFEVVGEVDFSGAHPKLSRLDGLDWGGSEQLGFYSDPMMVTWVGHHTDQLLSFYLNLADDWDEIARIEEQNPPPYGMTVGLSAIDKANHSGSGPIQILVPNPAFDAPLIDRDDTWMGTFLVGYLRDCFKWGGFPGFSNVEESELPREELDYLKDGLLDL